MALKYHAKNSFSSSASFTYTEIPGRPETTLYDPEWTFTVKQRLIHPLFPGVTPSCAAPRCAARRQRQEYPFATQDDDFLSCLNTSGCRTTGHDNVVQRVNRELPHALMEVAPAGAVPIPGHEAMVITPDIAFVDSGENHFVDVRIVNPTGISFLLREFKALEGKRVRPTPALDTAINVKNAHYAPLLQVTGGRFTPFIASSFGTLTKAADKLVAAVVSCPPQQLRADIQFIIHRRNFQCFERWKMLNGVCQ
jgi:hypothetical protein